MEIREATKSDWGELWPLLSMMGKIDNETNAKNRFLNLIQDPRHFLPVATNKGKIIGYGWVQDYGYHLRLGKKSSRMHDLFVHPEYRNIGAATAIFESIKTWAKEHGTTWLQWNSSASAVGFYKKIGLTPLVEDDDTLLFEIEYE